LPGFEPFDPNPGQIPAHLVGATPHVGQLFDPVSRLFHTLGWPGLKLGFQGGSIRLQGTLGLIEGALFKRLKPTGLIPSQIISKRLLGDPHKLTDLLMTVAQRFQMERFHAASNSWVWMSLFFSL
jgi:hypothetical protein